MEKQIKFAADKNGKLLAYCRYVASFNGLRWFRMNYDQAKIEVATGQAKLLERPPQS